LFAFSLGNIDSFSQLNDDEMELVEETYSGVSVPDVALPPPAVVTALTLFGQTTPNRKREHESSIPMSSSSLAAYAPDSTSRFDHSFDEEDDDSFEEIPLPN
jgi:hypothetical protein